jgi:hypothetical protein
VTTLILLLTVLVSKAVVSVTIILSISICLLAPTPVLKPLVECRGSEGLAYPYGQIDGEYSGPSITTVQWVDLAVEVPRFYLLDSLVVVPWCYLWL